MDANCVVPWYLSSLIVFMYYYLRVIFTKYQSHERDIYFILFFLPVFSTENVQKEPKNLYFQPKNVPKFTEIPVTPDNLGGNNNKNIRRPFFKSL